MAIITYYFHLLSRRTFKTLQDPWVWVFFFIFALLFVPLVQLFEGISTENLEQYLWSRYFTALLQSLMMMLLVVSLVLFISLPSAWILSRYEFWGARFFLIFLSVSFSIPTFVLGYIYSGIFEYSGLFSRLMNFIGLSEKPFSLDILHPLGLAFIMALGTFPHVYLLLLTAFKGWNKAVENAQSLKLSRFSFFFRILLPLSRVVLWISIVLVCMEVLADYATAQYFGVQTLSVYIFSLWFVGGNFPAARLGALLSLPLALLLAFLLSFWQNRGTVSSLSQDDSHPHLINKQKLSRIQTAVALFWLSLISLFSFILPILALLYWLSLEKLTEWVNFLPALRSSIILSSLGSLLTLIVALILSFLRTLPTRGHRWKNYLFQTTLSWGYALPGVILALSLLHLVYRTQWINFSTPYLLILLFWVYLVHHLAIAFGSLRSAYLRHGQIFHQEAFSLGLSRLKTLLMIDIPLLRDYSLSAFLLVFIDISKELSATLLLRPANVETLSTRIFFLAGTEQLSSIALPSLLLITLNLIPTFFVIHILQRNLS